MSTLAGPAATPSPAPAAPPPKSPGPESDPLPAAAPPKRPLIERTYMGGHEIPLTTRLSPTRLFNLVRSDALDLYRGRFVIQQFVSSVLRVRYQHSALGLLWTLLHPVLMLAVLSLVFSKLLRYQMPAFSVFLFAGLLPWQFFSGGVSASSVVLLRQYGLIRKVNLPLFLFPVSELAVAAVHMLLASVAMFLIMMAMAGLEHVFPGLHFGMVQHTADGSDSVGARLTIHLVVIPVGLVLLWVYTAGVSLILMTLTTYFRDMEHIISVGLQALYFATPIFYSLEIVQNNPPHRWLLQANPLTWIFEFFHGAIYYHRWPSPEAWIIAPACAFGALAIGYIVYKRHEHEFIFRL